MVRSLWTGASGMIAQQTNVDTIANNLANINTTGYKKEAAEFKSLLYQTIQRNSYDSAGERKPVGVQVGLGVKNSAITSQFTQGAYLETGGEWDFAIGGKGFFMVQMEDGSVGYTRSGAFKMSMGEPDETGKPKSILSDAEGHPVLNNFGAPIEFPSSISTSRIDMDVFGNIYIEDEEGNDVAIGERIGLVQFNNPSGLTKVSSSILKESPASGTPRWEGEDPSLEYSEIRRKYLEGSNVQAADEMVNLIVAQRAYEMNSKIITTSDTMLQQANNLRS